MEEPGDYHFFDFHHDKYRCGQQDDAYPFRPAQAERMKKMLHWPGIRKRQLKYNQQGHGQRHIEITTRHFNENADLKRYLELRR